MANSYINVLYKLHGHELHVKRYTAWKRADVMWILIKHDAVADAVLK